MAAKTRIYWVKEDGSGGGGDRLIEATSQSQAIRHAVGERFTAVIASPRNVAQLVATGVSVETAGAGDAE